MLERMGTSVKYGHLSNQSKKQSCRLYQKSQIHRRYLILLNALDLYASLIHIDAYENNT